MSIPKRRTISCPKCGTKFDTTVFQSLNTDYDKNVIESVISGDRFKAKCPQCGFVARLEYDVLYHDMKHGAMIWVVNPNQETYIQKLMEARNTSVPLYKTTRIVPDMNGLREKAACLAAGLDDRIVELCKVIIEGQVFLQDPDFDVDKSFFTYVSGKQIVYVYDHKGREKYAYLSDQIYSVVKDMFASQFENSTEKFQIIDHDWAVNLMNSPAGTSALSKLSPAKEQESQIVDAENAEDSINSVKVCPHCGHKIPPDSEFCQYCGKQILKISEVEKSSASMSQRSIPAPNTQQQDIQDSAQKLAEIGLNEIDGATPVIVEKAVLFHDANTDEYYLRCSFKSLTEKKIAALLADVVCYDIWGTEIAQIHDVQYLDLTADRDNYFGLEKKVPVTNENTRTVGINLKKIRLQDGTIIDAVGNKRKIPEAKRLLNHFEAENLVQQYIRETTTRSVFVPIQGIDFWRCACGEINPNSDEVCYHCKQEKSQIFNSLDAEHLSQSYTAYAEQERLAEEKKRKEQKDRDRIEREEQERIRKEKEHRDHEIALQKEKDAAAAAKRKKRAITTIAILLFFAVSVYLIGWHGIPYYRYSAAYKNYNNGDYYAAYDGFSALKDYRDSSEQANQALYRYACSLVEEAKYDEAVPCFEKLTNYLDSNDKLVYCSAKIIYDQATDLFSRGQYLASYEAFHSIPAFEDSTDKANEAGYQYAVACLNAGDYPAAIEMFDKIEKYADSSDKASEARYLFAVQCLEAENYEEATAAFEKITEYKDVANLILNARYQYALQLETAEKWEEAYKQFKELDKYKDSATHYKAARYAFATEQLNKSDYKEAADAFIELGRYKDSKANSQVAMYEYVLSHKNRSDLTTYKYLKALKKDGYKESKKIYDKLYSASVKMIAVNTKSSDYSTKVSSVSRYCSYLHIEFQLVGGPPADSGDSLTLTHRVVWPNGAVNYSDWSWNGVRKGGKFGCHWNGFTNAANLGKGKVEVRVYDKSTGKYLGSGYFNLI